MKRLYAVTIALVSMAVLSVAQVPTVGLPPFASVQDNGFDKINRQNLNVNFSLPIIHVNGRGLPLDFAIGYNSLVWQINGVAPYASWVPLPTTDATGANTFGWTRDFPLGKVTYAHSQSQTKCFDGYGGWYWGAIVSYSAYTYLDTLGTRHSFPVSYRYNTCTDVETATWTGYAFDNSGYYIDITNLTSPVVTNPAGSKITGIVVDTNGNYISSSATTSGTCPGSTCVVTNTIADTLGNPALIITSSNASTTYQYLYPDGNTHKTITLTYTTFGIRTNFGCAGIAEYSGTAQLPTSLTYPDGQTYSFTYEISGGNGQNVSGRISRITLPTGGYIQYSYGTTNHGISCTTAGGTSLTRTIYDGTSTAIWTYSATGTQTTVTDPITPTGNQSVFAFNGSGLPTTAKYYSGAATGTPLREVDTSYATNGTPSSTITKLEDGSTHSQVTTTYDSAARLTNRGEYSYGGALVRQTTISYASLGNNINNRPYQVSVYDGGGVLKAQTTYTYDQGTPTATSGTPNHAAVTGSRGNATTISYSVSGSSSLSRTFTYFDTGNVYQANDVNSAQTTYTYGACGNSFPTSVSLPLSMSRSMAWNCVGGVATSTTDENGQTTSAAFNDANYWRPTQTTDQANYSTSITYSSTNGAPSWVESALNFNGSTSTVDALATTDGLGRPHVSQRRQGQGAANFDSVETDYDVMGRIRNVTLPYSAGAGGISGATGTTTSYDALSRPTTVTDLGGGTVSYSYTKNDVLQTLSPAPTGENTKRKQLEYDALGRLTSVCEVTSLTGNGTCGQTQNQTGYWTTYTYDLQDNLTNVTQNAQAGSGQQTRSYAYDGLSRLTSETNPETGTTSYTYDTDATCGTSNGDLVKRVDAVGNTTCYHYDVLHRVTSITYPSGSYAGVTPAKTFVYDTAPTGYTIPYPEGRLTEAYTGNKTTDLIFNYSARGEIIDTWESTPHSGGYYHVSGSYWANGALNTLSGLGLPTITYSADGEGRPSQVSASSGTNPVSGTTYNVAGQPTQLSFGTGDSDSFTYYETTTGRQHTYQFNIGSNSASGTLTWNANGTLQQNVIVDPFNSANQQTCAYGHDDLVRIGSVRCDSGQTHLWGQDFRFDMFGNIVKTLATGYGGTGFAATYSSATNRVTNLSFTYDANGNTTQDNAHTYAWDAEGRPVTLDTIGATYDALGRMVEQNRSGAYTQIVYGLDGGKLALMNGQTLAKAFVPLPAGAVAVYASGGLSYFRHPDWLGSSRISSDPSHSIVSDLAYAPYSETYAESGTPDRSFTGQNQDTISNGTTGLYDFLYREYAQYGRWISPDPAGQAAADPGSPQTWNRYAYVANNPLASTDPLGLVFCLNIPCEGGGGWPSYDVFGYCPPWFRFCGDYPFGGGGAGGDGGGGGGGGGGGNPAPAPNPPSTGGKPPLSGETLGIPNGMRIPVQNPWSVILPTDPTCEFGPCVTIGNGFTAGTLTLTTLWQGLEGLLSRLASTAAAIFVVKQELDKNERCAERLGEERKFCSQKYWNTDRARYGRCIDRAKWRYNNCLRGWPDPGPLDPAAPDWSEN